MLLLLAMLALLLSCAKEPPPPPSVPNAPEDLSTWAVPEFVQPPSEPTPEPVASPEPKPTLAEQVLDYVPGTPSTLTVAVDAPLDVVLERGEQSRNVLGGDRTPAEGQAVPRLDFKEGASGIGETLQHHLFFTATQAGLTTGFIVTTTRRTYLLTLKSVAKSPIRTVRWRYPADPEAKPVKVKEPGLLPDPAEKKRWHVGYTVEASQPQAPEWMPRVYDDGRKMFLVLPEITLFETAPMVRMIGPNGPALVNARTYLNVIIVDQLAPRLELRVGLGATAEVVTIARGALRTIQCPDAAECPVFPLAAQLLARKGGPVQPQVQAQTSATGPVVLPTPAQQGAVP